MAIQKWYDDILLSNARGNVDSSPPAAPVVPSNVPMSGSSIFTEPVAISSESPAVAVEDVAAANTAMLEAGADGRRRTTILVTAALIVAGVIAGSIVVLAVKRR